MFERWMSRPVAVWVVGLLMIAAAVTVVVCSAMARITAQGSDRFGAAGRFALEISRIPEQVTQGLRLLTRGVKADLAVSENRFSGQSGFRFSGTAGSAPQAGYLVLSRYDGDASRSIVELVDLDAQRVVHVWAPDFAEHNARSRLTSNLTNVARDAAPGRTRMMHPLLTPDGGLIFQSMSPLVKVGACSELQWTIDRVFHHSNEPHPDGGYLTSIFVEPQTIPRVSPHFKEDGIVHVSDEGQILYEKSVAKLLVENGYAHLIYGLDFYSDDPLHLNDVQAAPVDGPYFRKGDLFLSLRNVSAIVLYRPSTNRVVWMKQGPWVNQHDVDVLDDHRIAVFNNNRFNYADGSGVDGANDVVIYDFAQDRTESPYRQHLQDLQVRTISEGRSEILPDGDVVVEESDYGRVLRLGLDGRVRWEYVNRASDGQIYMLNWTRYVAPDAGKAIVTRLQSANCGAAGALAAR